MPFSFRNLFSNGGRHGSHRRADPSAHNHSTDRAGTRAGTHNAATGAGTPESGASAIPSAGIRAGEIIGHRLWWAVEQDHKLWLRSLAHPLLWVPGEPVKGNTREIVRIAAVITSRPEGTFMSMRDIWGGVYSYPTSGLLSREILYWSQWGDQIGKALICGTVKLWGEVVEHNEGYRAEYAKVHSLRAVVWGAVDLEVLRARYLSR